MLIEQVARLTPKERLDYWIQERHQIYIKRKLGKPKPWTNDTVLQSAFFTNPFRENDKVTVWFRENLRHYVKEDPALSLFATMAFRWFNLPETAHLFMDEHTNLYYNWDVDEAKRRLAGADGKVFTGAYMIVMPAPKGGKAAAICDVLDSVWSSRNVVAERIARANSLQRGHEILMQFKGVGGFTGYEMVSDLRHTCLLRNATDIMTWCHLGPGATWGFHRVTGRVTGLVEVDRSVRKRVMRPEPPPLPGGYRQTLQELLTYIQRRMPTFEMRDVEHSLCEFDKYERYRLGAQPRRRYKGL